MIADDVTPPHAQGADDRLGQAGTGPSLPVPAHHRPTTLDALEAALQHVTDIVLGTVTQSEGHSASQLVRDNLDVIADAVWAAHHYRRLGHRPIDGDPAWHQITSWVQNEVVQAGDLVVKRVIL